MAFYEFPPNSYIDKDAIQIVIVQCIRASYIGDLQKLDNW